MTKLEWGVLYPAVFVVNGTSHSLICTLMCSWLVVLCHDVLCCSWLVVLRPSANYLHPGSVGRRAGARLP